MSIVKSVDLKKRSPSIMWMGLINHLKVLKNKNRVFKRKFYFKIAASTPT